MRFLQLLEQINEISVNPVYRQMETNSTREDPYFKEMEESWSGGVGDFGNAKAAYAIQRHPSYYDYHDALVQSVANNLGDSFTAYRLLPMEQLKTWKQGDDLPPMGISVSKKHAEAFRKFAPNRNKNDLVLATFSVPAEAVIMLGHEGEQELVIDPNHVSAHTLNMLNETIHESNVIPKELYGLAAEARKAPSFDEFKKDFLQQIKHGTYWHVTDDPNFRIDPKRGPRDMSSMASGGMSAGKLMVTSHLENWTDYYNEESMTRPYAALIDMSRVPRDSYRQVNRGFGNEFFVSDPSNAQVISVMPIKKALAYDERVHSMIPSSEEALREFYELVTKRSFGEMHEALTEDVLMEQTKCGIYNALEKYRPDLKDKYEKVPAKRVNSSILFLQDHGLWDDHAQDLAMEMTQLKRAEKFEESKDLVRKLMNYVIGLIRDSVKNPPVPYRSDA